MSDTTVNMTELHRYCALFLMLVEENHFGNKSVSEVLHNISVQHKVIEMLSSVVKGEVPVVSEDEEDSDEQRAIN